MAMQPTVTKKAVGPRGNCIGCQDCTGLCQAVMEMAWVPETVLKSRPVAR
jgi:formate hydrogenlyase subunit 6/NADH:ubiquinone oxidoreductase subunit I